MIQNEENEPFFQREKSTVGFGSQFMITGTGLLWVLIPVYLIFSRRLKYSLLELVGLTLECTWTIGFIYQGLVSSRWQFPASFIFLCCYIVLHSFLMSFSGALYYEKLGPTILLGKTVPEGMTAFLWMGVPFFIWNFYGLKLNSIIPL